MASSPPSSRLSCSPLSGGLGRPSYGSTFSAAAAASNGTGGIGSGVPPPLFRRKLTYSSRDLTHPHNDPVYLQADDEDAKANGVAHPYTMAMMWVFFVNNIIDTGALGLPNAFVQSGWLLSCLTLLASGLMSTITVLFTLETMARTTGILEWKERQDRRWRRRRRRGAVSGRALLPGMIAEDNAGDSDLDEYEEGEAQEEQEVLEDLSDSLKKNKQINPEAQKYGTFSPAETPIFGASPAPDALPTLLSLDVADGNPLASSSSLPNSAKNSPKAAAAAAAGASTLSASNLSALQHATSTGVSHESQPLLPPRHSASPSNRRAVVSTAATGNTESPRVSPKLTAPRMLAESPRNTMMRAGGARATETAIKAPVPAPSTGYHLSTIQQSAEPSSPERDRERDRDHAYSAAMVAALAVRSASGRHLAPGARTPISAVAAGRGYPITSPAHDPAHVHLVLHNKPIHHLSYRRTDFTLMSQLFGGYPLSFLTQFSVTIFSFVSLWVTAAIFAQSVDTLYFQYRYDEDCNIYNANQSAGCYRGYYLITGVYAVLVVYLTLKDIAETARTQAVLTAYRFFAFALMMATCFVASFHDVTYFASPDGVHPAAWSPQLSNQATANSIPTVNWHGFDAIFTIATVSLVVQYNMPDIVGPLRTPYKRHSNGVLAVTLGAILACVALYIGLGLVCSFTIGVNAYPLITLNWAHFTGLDGGWGLLPKGATVAWWAEGIKLGVMLFPPISMVSCFPLIAISLSENLRSSIPARIAARFSPQQQKFACRLFACIPPLVLTCVSGQVDLIFKVAGFVAFLIQLLIPCLLQWTSIRYCKRIWGPGSEETPFSFRILSKPWTVIGVFAISCAFAAYSLVAMINEAEEDAPTEPTRA